jgi:hypothetical protein
VQVLETTVHTFANNDNDQLDVSSPDSVISLDDDDSFVANASQKIDTARFVPGVEKTNIKFPSSFYVVDVHKAFTFRSTYLLAMEPQFEQFFQLPWKSSTYYDHKARWFNALRDARDNAVAAGYTEDGLYSRFLAVHATKDAEVKAARRKLRTANS